MTSLQRYFQNCVLAKTLLGGVVSYAEANGSPDLVRDGGPASFINCTGLAQRLCRNIHLGGGYDCAGVVLFVVLSSSEVAGC